MNSVKSASAATVVVIKKGTVENMKADALELSQLYGSNIQIQIDVKRDSAIALLRITEYNI